MRLLDEVRCGLILSLPFLWLAAHLAGPNETRSILRSCMLVALMLVLVSSRRQKTD